MMTTSMASPGSVVSPFDEAGRLRLVRYLCACGHSQPLCRLYFCRYCVDLRCGRCVCHEVDSHYCPNCLENMPSAEARLKKNRCANCFDCPSCGHTLSTRATTTGVTSANNTSSGAPEEALAAPAAAPAAAKKVYYLACGFCRWTTRDIGLPDQPIASGGWSEPDDPGAARFAQLQDHYRGLAQREKLERESRRFLGRKLSYMQLADKYGLSAAFARRKAGLPPLMSTATSSGPPSSSAATLASEGGGSSSEGASLQAASDAKGADEVEASFNLALMFERAPDLHRITRLEQRLAQPDAQPELSVDARPRHKHLAVKKSQRCRKCEHNLSKPEYNPTSIKFKIQLAAFYHVPEIIVFSGPGSLEPGKTCSLVLKVTNPAQHPTEVHLAQLDDSRVWGGDDLSRDPDEDRQGGDVILASAGPDEGESSGSGVAGGSAMPGGHSLSLARPGFQVRAGVGHRVRPNATFVFLKGGRKSGATSTVSLPQRDDAAEFDEGSGERDALVDDDKDLVAWRRANKVGLNVHVSVDEDLRPGVEVVTGFNLGFVYTNTVPALDQREVQVTRVTIPVYVVLGRTPVHD